MEFEIFDDNTQFGDLLRKKFPDIYQTNSEIYINVGWNDIVYELFENINLTRLPIQVSQVKEKFGGLRFYYTPQDPTIDQLIINAKHKASQSCQKCGEKGTLIYNDGWLAILCEYHIKKQQQMSFCVDKAKSLAVMKQLLSHIKESDQIMISHRMNPERYDNAIDHKHQLEIVEIFLDESDEFSDVSCVSEKIYEAYNNGDFDRSDPMDIHYGSFVSEEEDIIVKTSLYNTTIDSNVCDPSFTYDEQYQCWMIKNDLWGATGGINYNGTITILDFSKYNLGFPEDSPHFQDKVNLLTF